MTNHRDIEYLNWLISQIEINSSRTYFDTLYRMHETEFVWIVPNDDNRIGDAFDLRSEFLHGTHGWEHEAVLQFEIMTGKGASVLEILIGLSRRVAFTCGGEAPWWAWQLMGNLGLYKFPDPLRPRKREKLDDILYSLIWRTYESNGEGGFFPLNNPREDQTKVEIWYQMNEYALEIQEQ